ETFAIHASGLVFVQFRGGIPPVLAQHDAGLYFVPAAVKAQGDDRPPAAGSKWTPGLTGDDDKALSLTGTRELALPRGKSLGGRRYEFIDYDRGTLEFWVRPNWTSGSETASESKVFLSGAFWPTGRRLYAGDDEEPKAQGCLTFNAPGGRFPSQQ